MTTNDDLFERLHRANARVQQRYPGENRRRQPVHTVYGGAHLFRADTASRLGTNALRALDEYAPRPDVLAEALGLPAGDASTIRERVIEKLEREPVEDFRLDFEDGYGNRPDREEDDHAVAAAREVARGAAAGTLPPFVGIRVKPLTDELCERALRTTELFLVELLERTSGNLPGNFVVTLPKITSTEQVAVLAERFSRLEAERRLPHGALKMELMIETPQSILDERGVGSLPALVDAGGGRITAAHFGTYDYTASLGITAAHQHMRHPVCDFARQVMQVLLSGTGVWLSDGATNVLPVPVHRAQEGAALTSDQIDANRSAVHRAWKQHYDDIRHSLTNGYYQGWDLHPAQLPVRYGAVFSFFLEGLDAAGARLRAFLDKAAQATLLGDVFDDAATGQGLLNYFLRAIGCGALTEAEAVAMTGLGAAELATRSFVKILAARKV